MNRTQKFQSMKQRIGVAACALVMSWTMIAPASAAVNWSGSNDPNNPGDASLSANWGGFSPNGDEWRIGAPAGLFIGGGAANNLSASAAAASGAFKLGLSGSGTARLEMRSGGTLSIFNSTMRVGAFSGARGEVIQLDGSAVHVTGAGNNSDLFIGQAAGSTGIYDLRGGLLNVDSQISIGTASTGTFFWSGGTLRATPNASGQRGLTFGANGVMHIIGSGGTSDNVSGLIGAAGGTMIWELRGSSTANANSLTHLRLGIGGAIAAFGSFRPAGALDMRLTAGVALTNNDTYLLIDSFENMSAATGFASLPNALWNVTGNAPGSKQISVSLNAAQLKGSLNAALGGSVSFAPAAFGYVEIVAPNHATDPLFVLMAINGDTTMLLSDMIAAGYVATNTDPLLTGNFNLLLTLDPDTVDEMFAWDVGRYGLTVSEIGVTDQPAQQSDDAGDTGGDSGGGAVPEPATLVLLGIGMIAAMRRQRR